ncbi:MAG: hypothetical protein HKN30_00975 [Sulfitobacter sp.]|nr:hypothetical protein [Sulfitobacter sp.]
MRGQSGPGLLRGLLSLVLIAAIGSLPFTWAHLFKVASFDLQVPYIVPVVLGLVLLSLPRGFSIGLRSLSAVLAPWLLLYLAYLLMLPLLGAGESAKGMVLRQLYFVVSGLILALGIVAVKADPRVLRAGGLLAILSFVAVTEMLARPLGLGWSAVIERFLQTGDLEFVFYKFLTPVFQQLTAIGSNAKASDKNGVTVAILAALLLFRAGYTGRGTDRLGQLVTVFALLLLVLLNTRSVLLMAGVALPLAAWIGMMRFGIRSPAEFILKSTFLLAWGVGAVLLLSVDAAAVSLIGDRFSFSDGSSDGRMAQYAWAIERIEAAPIWGSGIEMYKGQVVHNLFLGAWMHAGLFAMLCVLVGYVMLCAAAVAFILRLISDPGYWVLPLRAEWIAVLPLVPLFRVWISGDAGHPSYAGWVTLLLYAGLITVNGLARGSAVERPAGSPLGAYPA